MWRMLICVVALSTLAACQTTGGTFVRPGYEAGGMCNGGAHCGWGR